MKIMPNYYAINRNSRVYKKALLREMAGWKYSAEKYKLNREKEKNDLKIGENNSIIQNYNNQIIKSTSIYQYLIDYFKGSFGKGLSLGSGSGEVEKNLIEMGLVNDFDKIDIIYSNDLNDEEAIISNDLNFISLPEAHYDIILAHGILHHIINLEHLLLQINKALKVNGIFVIYEYIGESKQQWKKAKVNLINGYILNDFPAYYKLLKITIPKIENISPFESIRSEEILPLIDMVFPQSLFEFKWNGIVYTVLNNLCAKLRSKKNLKLISNEIITQVLEHATEWEKLNRGNADILDCTLFTARNKNNTIPIVSVTKWSRSKIKKQLNLNIPIPRRLRKTLSKIKLFRIIYDYIYKLNLDSHSKE